MNLPRRLVTLAPSCSLRPALALAAQLPPGRWCLARWGQMTTTAPNASHQYADLWCLVRSHICGPSAESHVSCGSDGGTKRDTGPIGSVSINYHTVIAPFDDRHDQWRDLRAHGDGAPIDDMATIWGGVVNAVLDPILIFGLDFGADGAAIASVAARFAMPTIASSTDPGVWRLWSSITGKYVA